MIQEELLNKAVDKGFKCKNYEIITIYDIMKWLRENKKIYIMIDRSFSVWNGWHYFICIDDDFENPIQQSVKSGRTYEVAALNAIEYTLNNLI